MSIFQKAIEALKSWIRRPVSGFATPKSETVWLTSRISLEDIMELYFRDPTCKASVDLLASAVCGAGFYTTINPDYERAEEAKQTIDEFNEKVNLDNLLLSMSRFLIACGNDFWLKIAPDNLTDLIRLPIDSVEKIEFKYLDGENGLKIPYNVTGYKLSHNYGNVLLKPEAVIHWRINIDPATGYGIGVLNVLLHSLSFKAEKRPAFAELKAKIEKTMPKIFERYAGPDVLAMLEGATEEDVKKFQRIIRERPPEGAWLFWTGKGEIQSLRIDPRARFEFYIDHILNQVYLGCESPVSRLFTTPGFTEASARVAADFQDVLVKPIQRYIKRQVEREIFNVILAQAGFDPAEARPRLNWGAPETPEIDLNQMLKAAELGLIRIEEFRKNAAKFGWELWEKQREQEV